MTVATNRITRAGRTVWALALILGAAASACADEAPKPPDETKASRVTLQAKGIRLDEALRILREQTGNPITDARASLDPQAANPALDLDLKNVPFLEALDEIARRANVALTRFTGDGSIGILAGRPPAGEFVAYSGPFRFELKQFTVRRDYQAGTATADAVFEASWEPRVRPMLLSLKAEALEIRDDQGRAVRPRVAAEATDVVLRPETPSVEIAANLEAPERSASKLALVKARADVTMPADFKTFRLPSLAAANVERREGEVGATLVTTEVDGHVWRVVVDLNYPAGGPAFESFRQGLFNNQLWLQAADGSRVKLNGGFSTTGQGDGRLRFEYLFIDVPGKPGDYELVYEAPCRLVVLPLEFEFHDAPLP